MFESALTSKAVYNPDGTFFHYKYRDGEIIQILAKMMNFKPAYIKLPAGGFVGSFGALDNNLIDILGNAQLIEEIYTYNSIYLRPIGTEKLVFLIQKPQVEKIMTITPFYSLDATSTAISISLLVIIPIVYYFIQIEEAKFWRFHKRSFFHVLVYTFALRFQTVVPLPPPMQGVRVIYITTCFTGLILATIFQSSMIQNIQAIKYTNEIKTLDELYESNYHYYIPNELKLLVESAEVFKPILKDNTTESLTNNSKVAAIYEENYAIDLIDKLESDGSNSYMIVPDFPYEYYVSMMVPKNSPFQFRFNEIIIQMRETGIVQYQMKMAQIDSEKYLIARVKNGLVDSNQPKKLVLIDYMTSIYQYLIMNAICFMVLMIEIIIAPTHRKLIPSEPVVLTRGHMYPRKRD